MASHRTIEIFIVIVVVIIILESSSTTTIIVNARELRPSDHGLEYFYEPDESSSEMTSFFGPPASKESTPTTSSSSSGSTLPSAVKSPVTSSSKDRDRDDHMMTHVLVIGSLVCGLSALALMVASAFIYFLGNPKKQDSSSKSAK